MKCTGGKVTRAKVKAYMWANLRDHLDECGDVCMTSLAEDAANALSDREAGDMEFEVAYEVAEAYDRGDC